MRILLVLMLSVFSFSANSALISNYKVGNDVLLSVDIESSIYSGVKIKASTVGTLTRDIKCDIVIFYNEDGLYTDQGIYHSIIISKQQGYLRTRLYNELKCGDDGYFITPQISIDKFSCKEGNFTCYNKCIAKSKIDGVTPHQRRRQRAYVRKGCERTCYKHRSRSEINDRERAKKMKEEGGSLCELRNEKLLDLLFE